MSNLHPDVDYGSLPAAVQFAIRQWTRSLYSVAPGEVVSVEADKRRATVRSAFANVGSKGETLQRPQIENVPIVWPRGNGYSIISELKKGDSVLLVWSMRDLSRWKEAHAPGAPNPIGLWSLKDCVAVPGFGPGPDDPLTLASETGIAMQKDDAEQRIVLNDSGVEIKVKDGTILVEAETGNVRIKGVSVTIESTSTIDLTATGTVTVTSPSLLHNSTNVGDDHEHSYVTALHPGPAGDTGPPK